MFYYYIIFNYYLMSTFYLKQLFCIHIPSTHILVWVTYSVSSTSYSGVPNLHNEPTLKIYFPSQSLKFIF